MIDDRENKNENASAEPLTPIEDTLAMIEQERLQLELEERKLENSRLASNNASSNAQQKKAKKVPGKNAN